MSATNGRSWGTSLFSCWWCRLSRAAFSEGSGDEGLAKLAALGSAWHRGGVCKRPAVCAERLPASSSVPHRVVLGAGPSLESGGRLRRAALAGPRGVLRRWSIWSGHLHRPWGPTMDLHAARRRRRHSAGRDHRANCLPPARPVLHAGDDRRGRSVAPDGHEPENHGLPHRAYHTDPLHRPTLLEVVLSRCDWTSALHADYQLQRIALSVRLLLDGHPRGRGDRAGGGD